MLCIYNILNFIKWTLFLVKICLENLDCYFYQKKAIQPKENKYSSTTVRSIQVPKLWANMVIAKDINSISRGNALATHYHAQLGENLSNQGVGCLQLLGSRQSGPRLLSRVPSYMNLMKVAQLFLRYFNKRKPIKDLKEHPFKLHDCYRLIHYFLSREHFQI